MTRTSSTRLAASAGAEIDLILTLPGNTIWAIEIKRGLAPKLSRGFYHACEDLNPVKRFVVYSGRERFPLNPKTEAISLSELAHILNSMNTMN